MKPLKHYTSAFCSHRLRLTVAGSLLVALAPLLGGCPLATGLPRPDDDLEPNDTLATATVLTPGVAVTARATQFNDDVFVIQATAGQTIRYRAESLAFEVCPLFTATGPGGTDGTVLYREPLTLCRRFQPVEPDVQAPGTSLTIIPDEAFELLAPATTDGPYYLTITEGAEADNIFTFSWDYRLTATLEPSN